MGRTACTEPQCLYSRAIPLLPLWAVRPVQNLSACTVELYHYSPYGPYGLYRASVPVQESYTSTSPMGLTPCTEPQCLYKGALYLYLLCCVWVCLPMPDMAKRPFTSCVEQFNAANGIKCRNRKLLAFLLSQGRGHRPWPSIHARRLTLEAFLPAAIKGQCSYRAQSVEEEKQDTILRIISDPCTALNCQWLMTNLGNKVP